MIPNSSDIFAVFVVVKLPNGNFAATTRAKDRNEEGKIGLPGGKVDFGESPENAARREAHEEGWDVIGELALIHTDIVEGRLVAWYKADNAVKLINYKEKGRIAPVEVTKSQIAKSGYGNEFIERIDF